MIGAVASRWGLDAALGVLLLQPLAVGLAAWGWGRRKVVEPRTTDPA